MKKFLALLMALMLLFGVSLAENTEDAEDVKDAEVAQDVETADGGIKLDVLTMEDGFTFAIPRNWNYREIMEDEKEKGIFLQGYDLSRNLTLTAIMEAADEQVTPAILAEAMAANTDSFFTATVVKNQKGQELILFVTADGRGMGYIVLDGAGTMVTFLFRHADDSVVIEDEVLTLLMAECAQSVCYADVEE